MNRNVACILVYMTIIELCCSMLVTPDIVQQERLVASIVQITHYYIHQLHHHVPVIVSIENEHTADLVDLLLSSLQDAWLIQTEFHVQRGIYVFFSSSTTRFETFKEISIKSLYIFVFDTHTSVIELNNTLANMMRTLWNLRMYRSVVLVLQKNRIDVYSMMPFGENNCNVVNEAALINTWNFSSRMFDRGIHEFSLKRMVKNMHGCPLNAVAEIRPPESMMFADGNNLVFRGPGAQIVDLMKSKFNFTLNVTLVGELSQLDRFGYVILPDKYNRIKELLESGEVYFGFGVFSHGIYSSPTLHLVNAGYSECFTWAAACGIRSVPSLWHNYLNEFSAFTWVMIAVVFTIVFLLKAISLSVMKPKLDLPAHLRVLFGMYKNCIGQAEASRRPRNRFFEMIWIQYCFIILSLYVSSLGSFMTLPLTGKNVETLEHILQLNMNVIGTDATFKIFNATAHEDTFHANIAKRFKLIRNESFDEIIRILVDEGNSIAFASKRIQLHYSQFRGDKVKSKTPICTFDECTVKHNSSPLILKRGAIFEFQFHILTQRAMESGILSRVWKIHEPKPMIKLINDNEKVFEIEKLYGALVAYVSGISLSILTFCCEFIVKYLLSPIWRKRRLIKLTKRLRRNLQHDNRS
ncbi:uncharacterized protein LOC120350928 [Nilaparvata lugens]|uniref:uncharacterized protein LOC120350928 n=1 Tax=Nilaparvata lugens TaxID=108931 RepID=UPI00193D9BEE|nr:uncharacterized protein LOC120350928 [Nilaparvata lugens]